MPVAAMLLAERDIGHTVDGVKESLSSWDGCMAHSYCKWPVIIGIVTGSLIIFSLVWCVARCLCCGMECCCGCLSFCNACCPSPRGRRKDNSGYQQAPPTPHSYQPPPPMNPHSMSGGAGEGGGGGGFRSASSAAQTATFDAPTKKHNEDALPAMPSWDTAKSHRVEEKVEEDVELEKMDRAHSPPPLTHAQQQQALLASRSNDNLHSTANYHEGGDVGAAGMTPTNARPYHDYPSQQHLAKNPYGSQRGAATGYFTGAQASPLPSPYGPQRGTGNNGYDRGEPYPPSAQSNLGTSRSYRSPTSGGYHIGGQTSPQSYGSQTDYYGAAQQAPRPRPRPGPGPQPRPYGSQTDYYGAAQQPPRPRPRPGPGPGPQPQPQPQAQTQTRMPQADHYGGSQEPSQQPQQPSPYAQPKPYEPSYPPSYHTQPANNDLVSPVTPSALTPGGGGTGRMPVQGGWREY